MKHLALVAVLLFCTVGCETIPVVNARSFYNFAEPLLVRAINGNLPPLSDEQKQSFLQRLDSHDRLLTEAEK